MEFPGLSFASGIRIQDEVRARLGLPVSGPEFSRSSFILVAAFGRCKFRLSPESVGVLLQAAIGGSASQFRVSQLGERTFKFVVSAKPVGWFVFNLRSISCVEFKVSFLWGNGGSNWRREYKLFLMEEESSWTPASKASHKSFADVVKSTPLTGANAIPLGSSRQPPARRSVMLSGANAIPLDPSHQPPVRRSIFERVLFPNSRAPALSAGHAMAKDRSYRAPARRSVFERIIIPPSQARAPSSSLAMMTDKLRWAPANLALSWLWRGTRLRQGFAVAVFPLITSALNAVTQLGAARAENPGMLPRGVLISKSLRLTRIFARSMARGSLDQNQGGFTSIPLPDPPPLAHQLPIRMEAWLVLFGPRRNLWPT